MASRNQMGQFDKNRRYEGDGKSRTFLNQQHMPTSGAQHNSFPLPSFNPAVPPPRLNPTSFVNSSSQSAPVSQGSAFQGRHRHGTQAMATHGTGNSRGGYEYQSVATSTPFVSSFHPGSNSGSYTRNHSNNSVNNMPYTARNNTPFPLGKSMPFQPRSNIHPPLNPGNTTPFRHGNNTFHHQNTNNSSQPETSKSLFPGKIPAFQHGNSVSLQHGNSNSETGKINMVSHCDSNPPLQAGTSAPFQSGNNVIYQSRSGASVFPGNVAPFPPTSNQSFHHRHNPPFSFPPPVPTVFPPPSINSPSQSTSQEDLDKSWVNNWLEQRQIKKCITEPKKTLKIGEAQELMKQCLNLTEQLKTGRDELIQKIDISNQEWNECLTKIEKIKEELLSVQQVLSDPVVIKNLQEKINKRKKKRMWFKNRMKRRYVEKLEDETRRQRLHKEIDEWQREKVEQDLAARKEASLKREAGGVLGEVRRKQTDARKLLELLKSIIKLREIRKSEGEKKGVYPKTSTEDDRKFTEKSEFIENLLTKRIKSYEDEEKALRVMMVEEEEEREKKEEQERLEQKALLNLSKEPDPLAEFRRYYSQAEERIEYLIQIRREWDAYLVPDHVFGASRIPDEEVSPSPPSSDVWSSVLQDGDPN